MYAHVVPHAHHKSCLGNSAAGHQLKSKVAEYRVCRTTGSCTGSSPVFKSHAVCEQGGGCAKVRTARRARCCARARALACAKPTAIQWRVCVVPSAVLEGALYSCTIGERAERSTRQYLKPYTHGTPHETPQHTRGVAVSVAASRGLCLSLRTPPGGEAPAL